MALRVGSQLRARTAIEARNERTGMSRSYLSLRSTRQEPLARAMVFEMRPMAARVAAPGPRGIVVVPGWSVLLVDGVASFL